jgi:hypothetical protein
VEVAESEDSSAYTLIVIFSSRKKRLYIFMPPPTLFFTLYVYALHEVTFVTPQPFRGGR